MMENGDVRLSDIQQDGVEMVENDNDLLNEVEEEGEKDEMMENGDLKLSDMKEDEVEDVEKDEKDNDDLDGMEEDGNFNDEMKENEEIGAGFASAMSTILGKNISDQIPILVNEKAMEKIISEEKKKKRVTKKIEKAKNY